MLMNWLATIALSTTAYTFSDQGPLPGDAKSNEAALGVHVLSHSSGDHSILLGLDARQDLGSDLLGTRLGIRGEWRPAWSAEPALAASWFFGDTFVSRSRDRQYNGDSLALSLAATFNHVRVFAETRLGSYHEGPGFIFLPRRPGDESAGTRSFCVGFIIPIGTTASPAQ
jgi:hypothetical protein